MQILRKKLRWATGILQSQISLTFIMIKIAGISGDWAV
jgi:hypothetical protein